MQERDRVAVPGEEVGKRLVEKPDFIENLGPHHDAASANNQPRRQQSIAGLRQRTHARQYQRRESQ